MSQTKRRTSSKSTKCQEDTGVILLEGMIALTHSRRGIRIRCRRKPSRPTCSCNCTSTLTSNIQSQSASETCPVARYHFCVVLYICKRNGSSVRMNGQSTCGVFDCRFDPSNRQRHRSNCSARNSAKGLSPTLPSVTNCFICQRKHILTSLKRARKVSLPLDYFRTLW